MSILNPAVGVSAYGGEMVWVGVFTQKNTFGYLAMCGFLCAYAFHPTIGRMRTALLGIGSALCLVMSGSMGALSIAIGAISYMALIMAILRARVTTPDRVDAHYRQRGGSVAFVLIYWTDITQSWAGSNLDWANRHLVGLSQGSLQELVHRLGPGSFQASLAPS